MENTPQPMGAPAHQGKAHVWILVLLVWAVALSLVTIGILVTREESEDKAETIALACQNGTTNAVNTSLERIADACVAAEAGKADAAANDENVTATSDFSHELSPLDFTYPTGWHIYVFENGGTSDSIVSLDDEPLGDCSECGGFFHDTAISAIYYHIGADDSAERKAMTADTIVSGLYKATVISRVSKTVSGGVLTTLAYTVSDPGCDSPGCVSQGTYEKLIFEGPENVAIVTFDDDTSTTEDNDAWAIVKDSIDFSSVK